MAKQKGTIEEVTISSITLGTTFNLLVYLPYNYSPLYTYPLLLVQDGKDYFQLGRLPKVADKLIEENAIHDMIIVGIPYETPKTRWEMYHPQGKHHEAYTKFLVHELLPFLTKRYAIDDLAGNRTLMGESLGGTVSLLTAIQYPHTFSNVVMHSPFAGDSVLDEVKVSNDFAPFHVYHVIGKKETDVQTTHGEVEDFLTPNQELNDILANKQMSYYFYDELPGNHTWKTWQPDIERTLLEMYKKRDY